MTAKKKAPVVPEEPTEAVLLSERMDRIVDIFVAREAALVKLQRMNTAINILLASTVNDTLNGCKPTSGREVLAYPTKVLYAEADRIGRGIEAMKNDLMREGVYLHSNGGDWKEAEVALAD